MPPPLPCFALHDGRAGNARQANALARRLDPDATSLALHAAAPWRWFAPRRWPGAARAFAAQLESLPRDRPALAVGCGRQAALATRLVRGPSVRSVQILDPRIDSRHWDVVVVPAHDGLRGENVIVTVGSLNLIDDAWLAAHRARAPFDTRMSGPICAVLVGGPTGDTPYALATVQDAVATLRATFDGTVHACTSQRTPPGWGDAIRATRGNADLRVWSSAQDGPNPYPYLLACASRIVCTPDSVNMVSESCATSLPVEYIPAPAMRGRVATFLRSLEDARRLRALGSDVPVHATPLRESESVAREISRRFNLPVQTPAHPTP